jgi:3-methyladenine DNA glycosylase AlkD
MAKLTEELLKIGDSKYKDFNSKLVPNIYKDRIIGVKNPEVKQLVKSAKEDIEEFLNELPHYYNEENVLHGYLLSNIKDYDETISELNRFLPYIDNWSVCDIIKPKSFKKNRDKLINQIKIWIKSDHTYTVRFGLLMLMTHYLDDDFKKEYLQLPLSIKTDEYYIKMMIAWYYATALAKQYDNTIKIIENKKLDTWIHNKTIQKAKESFRVSDKQKEYLNTLKIK